MKKNVYIGVMTVITVICIIAGCIWHVAGVKGLVRGNLELDRDWGGYGGGTREDVDLEAFGVVSMETEISDITVEEGERYSISYECLKGMEPAYEVSDGILTIRQKGGRNHWFRGLVAEELQITVTVPEKTELEQVQITSDIGDIFVQGIQMKECSIDSDVGDITVSGITAEKLDVREDVGEIRIDGGFAHLTVQSATGDVEISSEEDMEAYDFQVSADVGEVIIGGSEKGNSYEKEGDGDKTMVVTTNVGDIEIRQD